MDVLAYLDAGSGSVIIQAVVAGFAGVAVTLKLLGAASSPSSSSASRGEEEQGAAMPATAQAPAEKSDKVAEPTP